MKNKILFSVFAVLLFLVSCEGSKTRFVEFNNILVSSKNAVDSNFICYNKDVATLLIDSLYDSIPKLNKSLTDTVKYRIGSLDKVIIPENGSRFKESTVLYFRAIINLADSYSGYSILTNENITIDQLDSIKKEIANAETALDVSLKNLVYAQSDFVATANIKLENK